MTDQQQPRIVVGVDGSESAKQALRWAAHQAQLAGARLEVVTAWEVPPLYGWAGPQDLREFRESARTALADTLDEVLGADRGGLTVSGQVIQGNAARTLIDRSRGAHLLVVGNRGHGGFAEALLGSVGQHATHHSRCPVVVIRGENGDLGNGEPAHTA